MRGGHSQYGGSVLMPPARMMIRPESARQQPSPLAQPAALIITRRPESARRQLSPPSGRSLIVTSQATNLTQPVVSQHMFSAPITAPSSLIGSRKSSPCPWPHSRSFPVANSSAPRTAALAPAPTPQPVAQSIPTAQLSSQMLRPGTPVMPVIVHATAPSQRCSLPSSPSHLRQDQDHPKRSPRPISVGTI